MDGYQNYGPFLDPYFNTAPNIQGTQKGTLILTTTHMSSSLFGDTMVPNIGYKIIKDGYSYELRSFKGDYRDFSFRIWASGFNVCWFMFMSPLALKLFFGEIGRDM